MISILGCGWLGFPLARFLTEHGFVVKGSVRIKANMIELENNAIEPFHINLSPEINTDADMSFFENEILILNIPPERRPDIVDYHFKQAESLVKVIEKSAVKKVLFVSSTSVYPNLNREVFEDDALAPEKESGKALLQVENLLLSNKNFSSTMLRLAGLIGYDRQPGRFLAGKKQVKNGNAPVNLIHRDDCIGIIYEIIKQKAWGEVFNGCADAHPTRREYYLRASSLLGLPEPEFIDEEENRFKIVSNQKVKNKLGYEFMFPDPTNVLKKGNE